MAPFGSATAPPTLRLSPFFLVLTRKGEGTPLWRHAEHKRFVRGDLGREFSIELAKVFGSPEVANVGGKMFGIPEVGPIDGNLGFGSSAIEQDHRAAAILQLLDPDLLVAVLLNSAALRSKRILIDGDDFFVRES